MSNWKERIPSSCTLNINGAVVASYILESAGRTDVVLLTDMSNIYHVQVISVFPARVTIGDNEFVSEFVVNKPLHPIPAAIAAKTQFSVLSKYETTTTRPKVDDVLEFLRALVEPPATNSI